MKRVVVLDYGSGNLRSAQRALERVGADVTVTADVAAAVEADGLVVPGVGAFAACMAGLSAVGGGAAIAERLAAGRPVLGICVGMQVLFDAGVEHGVETAGLGVLPGRVEQLNAPILPHMGWNTVARAARTRCCSPGSTPTPGSTSCTPTPRTRRTAQSRHTEHGERFVSAVEHGAVSATQFHPEKSGDAGAALLENWLRTCMRQAAGKQRARAARGGGDAAGARGGAAARSAKAAAERARRERRALAAGAGCGCGSTAPVTARRKDGIAALLTLAMVLLLLALPADQLARPRCCSCCWCW